MQHTIRHLTAILFVLIACSCAARPTQSGAELYRDAIKKYDKKKYYDAKQLFQEAVPLLKRKAEIIDTQFYIAKCLFYDKEYRKSAYCLSDFCKNYPNIPQTEEALYLQGYALYLDSPAVQLDNTQTEEAITVLKRYKQQYPTGIYQAEVVQYIRRLQAKLAEKAFLNAKQYHQLGHYQAAVISIHNFQQTYLDTAYDAEAAYLKFESQAKLADVVSEADQEAQWDKALTYYYELVEQYPHSQYILMAQKTHAHILAKVNYTRE